MANVEKRSFTIKIRRFRSNLVVALGENARFVLPVLIVACAKIVGAIWLYYRFPGLGAAIRQKLQPVGSAFFSQNDFLYLFTIWDSGFFMGIAEFGYTFRFPGDYAFLPAYPLVIRALLLVTRDITLSAVLPALVFGIAWMPFFQSIAERYMSRSEALGCTLVTAFFPFVFIYTTIAYSEPLFILASVACWYFYTKDRMLYAGLMAAVATVTRSVGIFIVAPIFLDLLFRRRWKRLLHTFVPILILLGWFYYSFLTTGDWLMSWSAQKYFGSQESWFRHSVAPLFVDLGISFTPTGYFTIGFIAIVGLLAFLSWRFDWRLGVYSIVSFLPIVGFTTLGIAYVRYFSFIFPIWLNFRPRNLVLIATICVFFYILSLVAWYQFLL